jgi:hypothetical protein
MPKIPINTNLGIDVTLTSPAAVTGISVTTPSEPKGKDDFALLSDILKEINPQVKSSAAMAADRSAKDDIAVGVNKINSMTREEAMSAHERGFPDVYNGWVRYGMYGQQAENSADMFHDSFRLQSLQQRATDPTYNWERDYADQSKIYLEGKEKDPFWNKAFAKASEENRKVILAEEFAYQSDQIKSLVVSGTVQRLRALPDKITDKLEADFFDQNPVTTGDETYNQRKSEFFKNNYFKYLYDGIEELKAERNVGITKTDFDSLIISAAEAHTLDGGKYSQLWANYLTAKRPDGTPSISDNPKYRNAVNNALVSLNKISESAAFGNDLRNSTTNRYDAGDYKKYADSYFTNQINQAQTLGNLKFADATLAVVQQHKKEIANNRPIPMIVDMLNRPVGQGGDTEDNKLSLAVAKELHSSGSLSRYFASDSKDALKWNMAVIMLQRGEPTQKIFAELGRIEQSSVFVKLSEDEKKSLLSTSGNIPANIELFNTVGQYYKNTGVTNVNDFTKKYIEQSYFKDPVGKWISKSNVIDSGVSQEMYPTYEKTAYKIFQNMYNDPTRNTPNISDTETDVSIPQTIPSSNNYTFSINSEGGYGYFTNSSAIGVLSVAMVTQYVYDDKGNKVLSDDKKSYKRSEIMLQIPLDVIKKQVEKDQNDIDIQRAVAAEKADTFQREKAKAIRLYNQTLGRDEEVISKLKF